MKPTEPDKDHSRSFLLGTLPETDRQAIEDRLVDDDQLFATIGAEEDELVEAYVRGELAAEERTLMEKGLLAVPEIRRRAELLRTMQVAFTNDDPAAVTEAAGRRIFSFKLGFWRVGGLAAILLVLAGVSIWWLRDRSSDSPLRADIPQVPVPVSSPTAPGSPPLPTGGNPETPKPQPSVEAPHQTPPPTTIATLVLAGGLTRDGGGTSVLVLTPQTKLVRVELSLDANDFRSYRATLFDAAGKPVWRSGELRPRGPAVTAGIPGPALRVGDYRIALEGYDNAQYLLVDNYAFSVRPR